MSHSILLNEIVCSVDFVRKFEMTFEDEDIYLDTYKSLKESYKHAEATRLNFTYKISKDDKKKIIYIKSITLSSLAN